MVHLFYFHFILVGTRLILWAPLRKGCAITEVLNSIFPVMKSYAGVMPCQIAMTVSIRFLLSASMVEKANDKKDVTFGRKWRI